MIWIDLIYGSQGKQLHML
ncbi:hypothetical protein AZE42_11929 [Rhizopogon vesiculosus]|uniref:Uncharacterized protein n=1 Tax=Rhizopogon vesiculosus TaxID=180088 RepID=A0A1J8PW39_9AGAM|nr:hypothetical protein AZE42_11929 [Rhizopogon vesiculosus]